MGEGLWAGRRCSAWSGDAGAWPAAPGLSTAPGWVPLSTCAWPQAPAIAGGLHRWSGGCGHASGWSSGLAAADEALGGAS